MRRLAALVLVAVVAVALLPGAAAALSVNDVGREVRCPTCNTPLNVSNAPVAQDMRQYIGQRIGQGWTKQQIIDGLVDEFGSEVLATPPKSGFDLVAWLVPAIAVALGLASIPIIARAWTRRSRAPATPRAPTPEEARRLDEELRRFRG